MRKTGTKEVEKRNLKVNSQKFMEGLYENTLYPSAEDRQEDKKDNSRSFRETEKTKNYVFHEKSETYMLTWFLKEQIQKHTPEFKADEARR